MAFVSCFYKIALNIDLKWDMDWEVKVLLSYNVRF